MCIRPFAAVAKGRLDVVRSRRTPQYSQPANGSGPGICRFPPIEVAASAFPQQPLERRWDWDNNGFHRDFFLKKVFPLSFNAFFLYIYIFSAFSLFIMFGTENFAKVVEREREKKIALCHAEVPFGGGSFCSLFFSVVFGWDFYYYYYHYYFVPPA